jgi:hypothetical protein
MERTIRDRVEGEERPQVHCDKMGCYHPAPGADVAWAVHDSRGYIDGGPSCDECGACDCGPCEVHPGELGGHCYDCGWRDTDRDIMGEVECIGLSFAYVCLDGGESLCPSCFEKAGGQELACDCT